MNKKKVRVLAGVCICIFGISLPTIVMAETSSRRANIKSSGNIDFENGEVYIASSDLTYLADEIDNLEDTYKQTTVSALNDVGTFFLNDGTIVNDATQNEVDTDEEKSALSFGKITEGIRNSQSIGSLSQTQATDKDGNLLYYETEEDQTNKDIYSLTTTDTGFPAFYQAANANNLSAGTAAWVNGTLIKGNGSDNAAYLEQNGSKVYNLGTGTSFDIKSLIGLSDEECLQLTSDNFFIEISNASVSYTVTMTISDGHWYSPTNYYSNGCYSKISITKNYNPSTGILDAHGTLNNYIPGSGGEDCIHPSSTSAKVSCKAILITN